MSKNKFSLEDKVYISELGGKVYTINKIVYNENSKEYMYALKHPDSYRIMWFYESDLSKYYNSKNVIKNNIATIKINNNEMEFNLVGTPLGFCTSINNIDEIIDIFSKAKELIKNDKLK